MVEDNEDGDEGTLLHAFAVNPSLKRDHLTDNQRWLLSVSDQNRHEFLLQADAKFGVGEVNNSPIPEFSYMRLDLYGPDNEKLFDGEADSSFVFLEQDGVAVMDFKTGFVEVTPAESNDQIAAYGLMWSDHAQVNRALVSINQPRVKDRLTIAYYDRRALDKARRELASIYHAAMDKNAPRIAGDEQCNRCKARFFCDEYKAKFEPLSERPDATTIATITDDQLKKLALAVKFADRIKSNVMDEMRKRIESGQIPDWTLKSNGENRVLADNIAAYKSLQAFFEGNERFDWKKYVACADMSWGKLTEMVANAADVSEGKAKKIIEEQLGEFIFRTTKQPTPTPKK